MSARKIGCVGSPGQPVIVEARQTRLTLTPEAVSLHKGGIEFRSQVPFAPWVEMTLTLQSPQDSARVNCIGVVVDCQGNKHVGYHVSMVFTSMSKQAEARLHTLVHASAA
jgi:PilZ domain